jgi:hypothetical protein
LLTGLTGLKSSELNIKMLKSYWAFAIAMFVGIMVISIGIWQHQGPPDSSYYHYYFGYGSIAAILIIFLLSQGKIWHDLGFSGISIVIMIIAAKLFWSYKDRPWFAPPRTNCDGDCYGWFSFENPLMIDQLIIVSFIPIGIGLVLKLVKIRVMRFLKMRDRN